MFNNVLIANRGAIVVRIGRTLKRLGITSGGVFSPADRDSAHLQAVDSAYPLNADRVQDSYIDQQKLFDILEESAIEAVHPGYGFLSENAQFAESLQQRGVVFVGPRPEHLRCFGLKHEARALAVDAGVNLLPGSDLLQDLDQAIAAADQIGYPVMLKSSAGGGGIGMQCCLNEAELSEAFATVQRLAVSNFGDASVFLEKYVASPRHVEVQAFGDGSGDVIAIGDRDCSLQRRHQKVIEESPAPNIPDRLRGEMHRQAIDLLASVDYENAGTVEFLYDGEQRQFYFLEVNTRLQVEHGVTEMTHGIDLVEAMLRQSCGDLKSLGDLIYSRKPIGHAIQARVYAEDPNHNFRPAPGYIAQVDFPSDESLRIDTWIKSGSEVSPFYDPMLAKVIARAASREDAIDELSKALDASSIHGIETNLGYLSQALDMVAFRSALMTTTSLQSLSYSPHSFDVLEGGAATTIQSWPGRQGYWSVGVPPSGPMDDLSFRLGNRLLHNDLSAAGLEIVLKGPRLQFNASTSVLIAGAECHIDVDGVKFDCFEVIDIAVGQTLTIGKVSGGARAYLLVKNGLDIPSELGSAATFTLGFLGGLNGRSLQAGDVVPIVGGTADAIPVPQLPDYDSRRKINILMGPHSAPDFFTDDDINTLLSVTWTVHYNSSRTGVRLSGPQPKWARADGGEAGLHPSNIHDNAYAFGSIDFTGDMPVILGPDGPSLGGFVCPGVVINADRWKLGQLLPGDQFNFVPVCETTARLASERQQAFIEGKEGFHSSQEPAPVTSPILYGHVEPTHIADCTIRRAGQEWLLVEFGPAMLDIELHLKVHAMSRLILDQKLPGIVEMTPGIRSLQVRFDTDRWSATTLTSALTGLLPGVTENSHGSVPSRIVHLPLSWDDPACREAISRYTQGVRPDAPWCPDNIEFIRRINGLPDTQTVKDIVFDASYLVMGLGDVYLGAPVATPLDPRHRLVTTKYNPARTWTAENSVGIGGSYLCVYGMEGPGGYQFVGRTLQVWNRHKRGIDFDEHWLLRGFDQIRFYEVDADELLDMRQAFPRGEMALDIETTQFDIREYRDFLVTHADSIGSFTRDRQSAFDDELTRWKEQGLLTFESEEAASDGLEMHEAIEDAVASPMTGSVWSIRVQTGQRVEVNDVLFVLEAMKSEFEVRAPAAGTIAVLVAEGQLVNTGQALAQIEEVA